MDSVLNTGFTRHIKSNHKWFIQQIPGCVEFGSVGQNCFGVQFGSFRALEKISEKRGVFNEIRLGSLGIEKLIRSLGSAKWINYSETNARHHNSGDRLRTQGIRNEEHGQYLLQARLEKPLGSQSE